MFSQLQRLYAVILSDHAIVYHAEAGITSSSCMCSSTSSRQPTLAYQPASAVYVGQLLSGFEYIERSTLAILY
jgi:hypothetical protein